MGRFRPVRRDRFEARIRRILDTVDDAATVNPKVRVIVMPVLSDRMVPVVEAYLADVYMGRIKLVTQDATKDIPVPERAVRL